jgi:hypothetical protein
MAGHDLHQRVEVSDDDRTVATAEVITTEGSGGTARVSLRAEPGHISPGRRASLVDAVLDLPEVRHSARVEAAFRLGDSESLDRLHERCQDVSTRSAGWSAERLNRPIAGYGRYRTTSRPPPHTGQADSADTATPSRWSWPAFRALQRFLGVPVTSGRADQFSRTIFLSRSRLARPSMSRLSTLPIMPSTGPLQAGSGRPGRRRGRPRPLARSAGRAAGRRGLW